MHSVVGHEHSRRQLAMAVRAGRLPQVLLVTGPQGVGKQRLGLWLGQLILCEDASDEPCGACRPCRQVLGLGHPDLHWFVPVPRPKSGQQDKQVEEVADLLAEVLEERRQRPLYPPPDGMAAHGVASARLLLRRAALTPAAGKKKVIVVGDAERLVPQESSPEAANALLKFLEEPPADTVVVLTAADPARVLPTVRSRAVPLRLGRLADREVQDFLEVHRKPVPKGPELTALLRTADGAIGRLAGGEEEGGSNQPGEAALAVLAAVRSGGVAGAERSIRQPPWQARGGFTAMLDALAATVAGEARTVAAAGRDPTGLSRALVRIQAARAEAQGNVNPQLLLAELTSGLAEEL